MKPMEKSFAGCCAELYELPIVEHLLGQSFHPGGTKLTRQLASATLISRASNVLDVACGNGNSARVVAAEFGAVVTGCDYSAFNLERAAVASRTAGLESRTQFVRASAERLPFAPESFDVVLCECSLCLFENMGTALEQFRRVLKPGGHIGISDFFLDAAVPESLDGLLGQVLCVTGAPSADAYRDALAQAGFTYTRVRVVNWTLADMIQRIRQRLKLLAMAPGEANIDLPVEWGDPAPVLSELESFIACGGAGYLMATARRQ